jgi:nitrate/TMAO reductase-like tetraheme cytochrome c subunit
VPNLSLILAALLAIAVAAGAVVWNRYQAASDRADKAEAALTVRDSNDKVVVKYVKQIVSVPGPSVVRDRIVRGLCIIPDVPSPSGAAGTAAPDAVAGSGDEARAAAESIRNAALNQLQCAALIEVVKPQAAQ